MEFDKVVTDDEIDEDLPAGQDISLLIYSNADIDITDYSLSMNAHCLLEQVKISKVVSPEVMILQHQPSQEEFSWFYSMQSFYNDHNISQTFKIKTSRLFVNRCYVWFNKEDNKWHRVRVVDSKLEVDAYPGALVWLVDSGEYKEVKRIDMMEISPKYCTSTSLTFRAHLVHISSAHKDWSSDATNYLQSLVSRNRVFYCVFLGQSEASPIEGVDYPLSYGVALAEKSNVNVGTVQATLVLKGLADSAGPCAGRHDLVFMDGLVPYYCRKDMVASFKQDPTYSARAGMYGDKRISLLSGLERATTSLNHLTRKKEVKRGFRSSRCYWMSLDALSIVTTTPITSCNREAWDGKAMFQHIPELMQNRMGFITLSYEGSGPSCFYIQMQEKWPELDTLMYDLQEISQHCPNLRSNEIVPGKVAVARSVDESQFKFWARVVIISSAANVVVAFFVDFGFLLTVRNSSIRKMPEYFENIPPFCARAHLDFADTSNPLMPSGVVNWTPQANAVWQDLIAEWSKSDPIYYAWQPRTKANGGVISLDELNQELLFDSRSLRWHPGKSAKNLEDVSIHQLKDHPWLKPFYQSIGINIVYEKLENNCYYLTFIPIWRELEAQGFIVRFENPRQNPFAVATKKC